MTLQFQCSKQTVQFTHDDGISNCSGIDGIECRAISTSRSRSYKEAGVLHSTREKVSEAIQKQFMSKTMLDLKKVT